MVQLDGVTRRYGDLVAVQPLDLHLPRGELFGFLGPNGAGKTTTVRMITGILRPSSGRITVGGHDLDRSSLEARRLIGYVPDRPALYERLTGSEFLHFVSGLWGQTGPDVDRRVGELLHLFGLDQWGDRLIGSYSHGMRQKILISAALVHCPEFLVIDEPLVGLDPQGVRLIRRILREFVASGGTVFLSTHSLAVAELLCDRIGVLVQGRLVGLGSLAELAQQSALSGAGLEEIYLSLTGGLSAAGLPRSLRVGQGASAVG